MSMRAWNTGFSGFSNNKSSIQSLTMLNKGPSLGCFPWVWWEIAHVVWLLFPDPVCCLADLSGILGRGAGSVSDTGE